MKEFLTSRTLSEYAPIAARLGLAAVLIWFGASQLLDQTMWTSFIPDFVVAMGISAKTAVILNGLFEVVAASLLALGIWVRPLAGLLFLHMVSIVSSVGLSPLGVRDVGIAAGLLSVALYGYDILSWGYKPSSTQS